MTKSPSSISLFVRAIGLRGEEEILSSSCLCFFVSFMPFL
jgi:hypothetical protein